ncbi:twin-arginine translocation signal domain-containing protein [Labrys sp. La1]|uniref:twin-arginine translocation signal domain-containing protein n=1 Tax=Labrys sp. La1 TaxID=3404917 RepID=UPI003EBB1419
MPFKKSAFAFGDLTDKRLVGRHLDRLDTHGVSRRDFLALASAGVAAGAAAGLLGSPSVAVAAPSGKLAYLAWTSRVEFMVQASRATQAAAQAFGLGYSYLDGQVDSQRQLNQAEEQFNIGANAVILHAPDGSAVKRIAQLAEQNKAYFSNVWATCHGSRRSTPANIMRFMQCRRSFRPTVPSPRCC